MPLPLTLTTEIIRWNESQPVSLLWVEQLKQNWNIKFARRDQNFPGILRCALNTILFPLFFWTPSLIIHVFCQRCVKHFCQTFNIWKWEHLLDRTASGQISETMHSKLCPFSICTQVAKEVYIHCIVWLYIGKIDENKVFARQYCQETCYRSWVAIATWAAR